MLSDIHSAAFRILMDDSITSSLSPESDACEMTFTVDLFFNSFLHDEARVLILGVT